MNFSENNHWKDSLKQAIKTPEALISYLELDGDYPIKISSKAQSVMSIMVPLSFASRIRKGDINDPILLQILPSIKEEIVTDINYSIDPLMEQSQMPAKGIIHKYLGRVLLICNGVCAVHCRYCFRREFDYKEATGSKSSWDKSFEYIANDKSINEVILSGGDPLLLTDQHIKFFIDKILEIKHIKRLRIHSRVPIVLPERITDNLVKILSDNRLQMVLVTHVNHANELDEVVKSVLTKFQGKATLLNQSTLLKGINDCADTLAQLSEKLFEFGVLPYYLHTLDKVRGTKHFHITDREAWEIHSKLQSVLSGFLVPKIVKEVPYKGNKIQLSDFLFDPDF